MKGDVRGVSGVVVTVAVPAAWRRGQVLGVHKRLETLKESLLGDRQDAVLFRTVVSARALTLLHETTRLSDA